MKGDHNKNIITFSKLCTTESNWKVGLVLRFLMSLAIHVLSFGDMIWRLVELSELRAPLEYSFAHFDSMSASKLYTMVDTHKRVCAPDVRTQHEPPNGKALQQDMCAHIHRACRSHDS